MTKICCMSLTLAVKIIGTFGLSLSILMINILVSNFFSTKVEEEFVIAVESWVLFGLNWTFVMKSLKVVETARTLLTCVLIYSAFALVANALLALGSLLKKPTYVLPWMYMQMISIIDQTIALILQLTQDAELVAPEDKSVWYVPACSIYLVISSYFWMVVSSARREWLANPELYESHVTTMATVSASTADNFNLPKTPSFLSSNVGQVYNYATPLAPPKYEVV